MTPGYGTEENRQISPEAKHPTHICQGFLASEPFVDSDRYRFARLFPDGLMALTVANLSLWDTGFIGFVACKLFGDREHQSFHDLALSARDRWSARVRRINLTDITPETFVEQVREADGVFNTTVAAILVDMLPIVFAESPEPEIAATIQ